MNEHDAKATPTTDARPEVQSPQRPETEACDQTLENSIETGLMERDDTGTDLSLPTHMAIVTTLEVAERRPAFSDFRRRITAAATPAAKRTSVELPTDGVLFSDTLQAKDGQVAAERESER